MRKERAGLWWRTSSSSGLEANVHEFGRRFAVFKAFGNHAQGKGLDAGNGLVTICAIAHDAGERGYFSNPASICFALEFDRESHPGNVPSGQLSNKRLHPTAAARDLK